MTVKLYVGNLSIDVTDANVHALFSEYGSVQKVDVATDQGTGYSKGFGFVEMGSDAEALQAIEKLNGHEYKGKPLHVRIAPGQDVAH